MYGKTPFIRWFKRSGLHRYLAAVLAIGLTAAISPGCRKSQEESSQPTGTNISDQSMDSLSRLLDRIGVTRGICVMLGDAHGAMAINLARETDLLLYLQLPQDKDVEEARRAVDLAGYYGNRIYVEKGSYSKIHLADNLADALIAMDEAVAIEDAEVLRVLHPQAKALLGSRELIKPFPDGVDDWSHPYHGPDNNPCSNDRIARAPYLTQFLADPRYAPLPQVTVTSAGRVFKAFGHLALKKREEPLLNTLMAFNGYNGAVFWKRDLVEGIMVHRNTMIATPELLYLGDDQSCKRIDTKSGRIIDEIIPPLEIAGGTFWKWMGLEKGILCALIGEQEKRDPVVRQRRGVQRGWGWGNLSEGFNAPENPWGFGRTVLGLDTQTKKVLWHHHEDEPIDSRALCMKNGRIYLFRFGSYLACLDNHTGNEIWRKTKTKDPELFASLGEYLHRQGSQTGWRTTNYLKCSDSALYFAGPQIGKLLALSTEDGRILWENPYNNYQLILQNEVLYGIGGPWPYSFQKGDNPSKMFDPLTGEELGRIDISRRGCTRPTGSIDALFFRASGGTIRMDLAGNQLQWISPMRPQCNDGVTIANGLLYWWPSICDCQFSLYGVTCAGPAGSFDFKAEATESQRLEQNVGDLSDVAPLPESAADWPTFRADNTGSATTPVGIPKNPKLIWEYTPQGSSVPVPTAPVAVGDLIFIAASDGTVQAFDAASGKLEWKAYTAGAIRIPPTVWQGRLLVGSGDGWVYCLEARTGRTLWRFRTAPEERKIPVYGSLLSTWPAASGVIVEDGLAYVASGINNYDGTYVYALDAATGKIKWENNTSGHLDPQLRTGVSVQGHMLLVNNKLYLAGGTAVSPAIYNLADGKCLNDPAQLKQFTSIRPRGWELFRVGEYVIASGPPLYGHPEYPPPEPAVSEEILIASSSNRDVVWLSNRKVMCFNPLDRIKLSGCVLHWETAELMISGWGRFEIPDQPLWQYESENSYEWPPPQTALAVGKNAVVLAERLNVLAFDLNDGSVLWSKSLPSPTVSWGLAVDRDGRVVITLKNGRILCFGESTPDQGEI